MWAGFGGFVEGGGAGCVGIVVVVVAIVFSVHGCGVVAGLDL